MYTKTNQYSSLNRHFWIRFKAISKSGPRDLKTAIQKSSCATNSVLLFCNFKQNSAGFFLLPWLGFASGSIIFMIQILNNEWLQTSHVFAVGICSIRQNQCKFHIYTFNYQNWTDTTTYSFQHFWKCFTNSQFFTPTSVIFFLKF